jgi:hypothetical protein
MAYETSDHSVLNFTHLRNAWDLFPYSCSSGYYFLWNSQLDAPKESKAEPENCPEALLRKELNHLKKSIKK